MAIWIFNALMRILRSDLRAARLGDGVAVGRLEPVEQVIDAVYADDPEGERLAELQARLDPILGDIRADTWGRN